MSSKKTLITTSFLTLIYSLTDKVIFFIIIYSSSFFSSVNTYSQLVIYWGGIQLLGAIVGAPLNLLGISGNLYTYKALKAFEYFYLIIIFSVSCWFMFFDYKTEIFYLAIIGAFCISLKSVFYGLVFRVRALYLIYVSLAKIILFFFILIFIKNIHDLKHYILTLYLFIIFDVIVLFYIIKYKIKQLHQTDSQKKTTRCSLLYSLSSSLSIQTGQLLVLKIINIRYPMFSGMASLAFQSRSITLAIPSSFSSALVRSLSTNDIEYKDEYTVKLYWLSLGVAIFSIILSEAMFYLNKVYITDTHLNFVLFSGVSGFVFLFSIINSIYFGLGQYKESSLFSLLFSLIYILPFLILDSLFLSFFMSYIASFICIFYMLKNI